VQTAFTVPLFFFIVEYFVIVSSPSLAVFFSFISGPGPKIILRTEQNFQSEFLKFNHSHLLKIIFEN